MPSCFVLVVFPLGQCQSNSPLPNHHYKPPSTTTARATQTPSERIAGHLVFGHEKGRACSIWTGKQQPCRRTDPTCYIRPVPKISGQPDDLKAQAQPWPFYAVHHRPRSGANAHTFPAHRIPARVDNFNAPCAGVRIERRACQPDHQAQKTAWRWLN